MGLWSYYFFAKLFLYFTRYIDFHVWLNLGFAVALVVPLTRRSLRIARQIIAVPAGIALLYHDAWMPPAAQALSKLPLLLSFDAMYLLELLGRFVDVRTLLILILIFLIYTLLNRKLRMSSFAILGILLVPLVTLVQTSVTALTTPTAVPAATTTTTTQTLPSTPEALDAALQNFYTSEAKRRVQFSQVRQGDAPFDIVLLHTCSLAWDDIDFVGLREHPLLKRFNVMFNHFNSAASYSGPAAIRVLRAPCGQQKHSTLYNEADASCLLMRQLQQSGFSPEWEMNHDGAFGGFADQVRANLGVDAQYREDRDAEVIQRAFDGSPVYDDYDVLSHWWTQREQSAEPRVALYYSGVSLHDGNRAIGNRPSSNKDYYKQRLTRYLDDLERFIQLIEQSHRRAVVVLVPEHGAAVRGDRMQISGLREIPTPAITHVPLGIALIGPEFTPDPQPLTVDQPSSFLALAQLLSNVIGNDPFSPSRPPLSDYVTALPQTQFVSENENTVIMQVGDRFMMRTPDGSWTEYDSTQR
ncbi:cellulose biosynthesis protein BcsG [Sinimarinibacterium sp. CAU 1509]|uniref:cellulose biosynthesis protein BcsG n=1 Tax=Sinimarinibacterium sp. CAU 1509 TaxID=2562283 RepID=UPI0010ABCCDF|nr:cellulose biosynthesis protein BcsG [Sinimarinibacterium sp. CAU 1509]TJY64929.1 cellulose biosynthesis protein BcsG [Sinimarinibacterium sp. CAU 1509]